MDGPSFDESAQCQSVRDGCQDHTCFLHGAMIEGSGDIINLVGKGSYALLEVCAPWDAPLSHAVREAGGKAMAIGLHNGYDMSTMQGFRQAAKLVRELRPRYLHVSPPCDPWTALSNSNQRNAEQVAKLRQRRQPPTLLTLGGNLLLTCSAKCHLPLADRIPRQAFLQGRTNRTG